MEAEETCPKIRNKICYYTGSYRGNFTTHALPFESRPVTSDFYLKLLVDTGASRFPEYENFPNRLASFELEQPLWNPVEIRLLALEGFFYSSSHDLMPGTSKPKCFYCGLVADSVGNTYEPYQIHARNGGPPDGDCGYLGIIKGKETCFDKGGGEIGWQRCSNCRLCSWEQITG